MEKTIWLDETRWLSGDEMRSIWDRAAKLVASIEQYNEWREVSQGSDLSFSDIIFDVFNLADALAPTGHIAPFNGVDDFLQDADGRAQIVHPPVNLDAPFRRLATAVRDLYLEVTGTNTVTIAKGKLVRPSEWSFHNQQVAVEPLRVAVRQLIAALADQVVSPNDARNRFCFEQSSGQNVQGNLEGPQKTSRVAQKQQVVGRA